MCTLPNPYQLCSRLCIVLIVFAAGCGTVATPVAITPSHTMPATIARVAPPTVPPTLTPALTTIAMMTLEPTNVPLTQTVNSQATAADPTVAALAARDAAHATVVVTAADGRAAYEMRCAPCHGFNGEGVIGPSFRDRPLLTDDYVLYRVRSGPEVMSAFTAEELPDEQVSAIVAYLQAEIVGRDVPDYTEEEVEAGRALYREYCRECHAVFGQGLDNLGPAINLWPPLSITQIVEGGLIPLPNMPRLDVTPDELRLIAAFLYSLAGF